MKKRIAKLLVGSLIVSMLVPGLWQKSVVQAASGAELELKLISADGEEIYLESQYTDKELVTEGEGFVYDESTNTLTLNNYEGQALYAHINTDKKADFTIVLVGNSKFTDKANPAAWDIGGMGMSCPIQTHIQGSGSVTISSKNKSSDAAFRGDIVYLEDTVKVKCEASSEYGYSASKTIIKKNATIEAIGKSYGYHSGGYNEQNDEIYGTLIAQCTASNYVQAYYYTSYNAKLGSDRVIYGGSSEKNAKKLTLVKSGSTSYMNYEKDGHLKYVRVCQKSAMDDVSVGKVSIVSVKSPKKGQIRVGWKKLSGVDGYVIKYTLASSNSYKELATVKGNSKTSYISNKLESGKKYKIKMYAYKTVNGKKVLGNASKVLEVKIR